MVLKPGDVEQRTFSTSMRGYNLDEVDDFLDEVVISLRHHLEELESARARIGELERREAGSGSGADEATVGRVLVAAQQTADKIVEEATSEAGRILADARATAESFALEQEAKRAEVDAEVKRLSALLESLRLSVAELASAVSEDVEEMDAVLQETSAAIAAEAEEQEVGGEGESEGAESDRATSLDDADITLDLEGDSEEREEERARAEEFR